MRLPARLGSGALFMLVALLLALPASAFAFTSSTLPAVDPAQNVAQAGVSVVRLVVTYSTTGKGPGLNGTPIPAPDNSLQCTGLGVLISSAAPSTNADAKNVWVLTDGNLINPAKFTCNTASASIPATTPVQLAKIEVLASNLYTDTHTNNALIGTLAVKTGDVTCGENADCSQGLALFAFSSSTLQPYIDLAPAPGVNVTSGQGIALINSPASAPPTALQAQQYLTPQAVALNSTAAEAGMPIVDTKGALIGMHLAASETPASLTQIKSLIASLPIPTDNTLHNNWNAGIQAYYVAKKYSQARTFFQNATKANPQFQAGTMFATRANQKIQSSGSAGNGHQPSQPSTPESKGIGAILSTPLLLWSVAGLVVLVILLVAVSFIRRRRGLTQFNQEAKAADRRAAKDAPYIAGMESQQMQGAAQQNPPPPVVPAQAGAQTMNASNGQFAGSAPPVAPMSPGAPFPPSAPVPPQMSPISQMSPVREAPCPNCRNVIPLTSQRCPFCQTWLSPSDSGYRLQARPQQVMPVDTETTIPFNQSPAPSYAVENQPTLVPLPPDLPKNGLQDTQKTIPYNIQKAGNGRLGLVVGTRTNPGIKRQHKPNEDSLFAAQGEAMFNASPQPFGLFVVADGMGGHANGQDASRLAIQTIINHMLPVLSKGENLDRDALKNLLVEGVQHANDAVFQHNMEQRADMGTTMTAALVVGSMAIVANVGDSRTYLYREPEGLKKITNDHSVVASLVEAGIIKPDDIYTHPKRNQIYRSLGEKSAVEVDSFFVDLIPGDELLLCSDGLWDMVRDPLILQVLRSAAHNPDQTGDALIQAALHGGGEDNVSVIVVSITDQHQSTGISGIHLLAKPDTVQMPQL